MIGWRLYVEWKICFDHEVKDCTCNSNLQLAEHLVITTNISVSISLFLFRKFYNFNNR